MRSWYLTVKNSRCIKFSRWRLKKRLTIWDWIQVFGTEIPKHVRRLSNFTENELRCVLFQIYYSLKTAQSAILVCLVAWILNQKMWKRSRNLKEMRMWSKKPISSLWKNGLDTQKAAFVLIVTDYMKTAEGGIITHKDQSTVSVTLRTRDRRTEERTSLCSFLLPSVSAWAASCRNP